MSNRTTWHAIVLAVGMCAGNSLREVDAAPPDVLFVLGTPDARAAEFGLTRRGEGYTVYPQRFQQPVVYQVDSSSPRDWPYIHPGPKDLWAGGGEHEFTIHFASAVSRPSPLFLVMGLAGGAPTERSQVVVRVNNELLPPQVAPVGDPRVAFQPQGPGTSATMIFPLPAGCVQAGDNTITIRLAQESWIIYDYVALREKAESLPLVTPPEPNLLAELRRGPLAGVEEVVFAVRRLGEDPHWYANFGSTLDQSRWRTYFDGGRLCCFNLRTQQVRVLVDEPAGGIRDPQVDYRGETVLFSRRSAGSPYFHLYEIRLDGSAVRQLTDGPYHDVEPTYLPDGDILFVSTRCNRRVNCHTTEVAVLYRCDADGRNLRAVSSNNEHDNTPWVLPNGQVLYTRWEYVDRNQMAFHHLWVTSPDGARQTVFFGNMHPDTTMIDAKPVPGSQQVVASFSPGHGLREHDGVITLVDPRTGPDNAGAAVPLTTTAIYRDPWAFSPQAFMAATGGEIVLLNDVGIEQTLYRLPPEDLEAGLQCHEPRPVTARERTGDGDQQRSFHTYRNRRTDGRLSRSQYGGSGPGQHQEAAGSGDAAQADELHRRHGTTLVRRYVHAGTSAGDRSGRTGRIGVRHGACPAQSVLRGSGRRGSVGQAHAELHDRDARRNGHLHRLPRTANGDSILSAVATAGVTP